MTNSAAEEWKKRALQSEERIKKLSSEISIKERTVQLLIVAGHLDKDRLEQATELAGGI